MNRLLRDESGVSLLEVVVSSALTLAVLAIATAFLVNAQTTVLRQERLSAANDEARAAMEQLDREVRSANFILPLNAGSTLVVHTQSNAPTAGDRCVQWVLADRELRRRSWPISRPDLVAGWRTIATKVVNSDLATPLFLLPDTPSNRVTTGGRTVEVTVLVHNDPDATDERPVAHRQSLTGRNVAAGHPPAGTVWPPVSPPAPCEVVP